VENKNIIEKRASLGGKINATLLARIFWSSMMTMSKELLWF